MEPDLNSHVPYAQLPIEVRALLILLNMTAFSCRRRRSRSPQEVHTILAAVWDSEKLTLADLDDSDRMRTVYQKLQSVAQSYEQPASGLGRNRRKFLQ